MCKFGVGFSRGFAQVRLAFSVFIALGRAPTRGVRNDEVIILRAPRHKCVWVWVQCSACPVLWLRQRTFAQIRGKSTLEIVQVDAGLSALCLGLEGLGLAGFGPCAPCICVSAVTKHFKGPLLRGNSVLRSVHTRCSCLMQPVCSGRRRCALAQCGRAPGPGWARKRGIRESPRTEARAHAQAKAVGSGRTVCVDLRRSNSKPSLRFRREVGGCHLQASVVSGICTG